MVVLRGESRGPPPPKWKRVIRTATFVVFTFLVVPLFLLEPTRYVNPSISAASMDFSAIYSTLNGSHHSHNHNQNHSHFDNSSNKKSNYSNIKSDTPTNAIEWLQIPEFQLYPDSFSDSWLMNKKTFLETNLSKIESVEDACFESFTGRRKQLRMPLDWLDFSVEHMSKWWRVLHVPTFNYTLERVLSIFERYRLERLEASLHFPPQFLQPTIALIAFQQYKQEDGTYASESRRLTISSLAATISSLVQVGMGRIVVVGYEFDDETVVRATFRELGAPTSAVQVSLLGSELDYVRVTPDMVVSKYEPVNLPKASLYGLRHAMVGNDTRWTQQWLGSNPLQWQYVYLTEPDTMLNTRPSALPHLKTALQDSLILAPHRLQPIPFEADVPESPLPDTFVPADFKTPIQLDSLVGDSCCDEQAGSYRPGSYAESKEHCGNFWWMCGFPEQTTKKYNHSRLVHYDFMRLRQGTGVVTLAGTEHGRRCLPKKQSRCERRVSPHRPARPAE